MAFKIINPDFAVAPQLTAGDFMTAAGQGFKTIINNRPDGEAADQLPHAEAARAAAAAGLAYVHIPIRNPTEAAVAELAAAIEAQPGPILAYCRSGTRSVTLWALAQAQSGADPDTLIAAAANGGYDLNSLRETLQNLSASAR